MRTEARFVKPSDYLNYFGEDLNVVLRSANNDSNKANLFLMDVEDTLLNWVDANTYRNFKWEDLVGEQKEALQRSILKQARYVSINGNIAYDSGYDMERGIIVNKQGLQDITICDAAINELKSAGLYCRTVQNKRRYPRWH